MWREDVVVARSSEPYLREIVDGANRSKSGNIAAASLAPPPLLSAGRHADNTDPPAMRSPDRRDILVHNSRSSAADLILFGKRLIYSLFITPLQHVVNKTVYTVEQQQKSHM